MSIEVYGTDVEDGVRDVFGVPVTNTPRNVLDIASHYPYNQERLRLVVNGSRKFPEYGSVSQYNHAGPNHELIPSQGDTVKLETAERPRYAVGFEQVMSCACSVSRSLESGDQVRFGMYDDNDGWFIEHNPSHADDQVDLVVREAGSDSAESDIKMSKPITDFDRYELRTAWYRVTRQLWRLSYEVNRTQKNDYIGTTAAQNGGPEVGNLPLRYEVTRGASSSALTLNAGSVALLTQGDKSEIRRIKTHEVEITTSASADGDTWFPQYAMRLKTAKHKKIVDTQISSVRVQGYGGAGDVRVMLSAHDPSNVKKSGPSALTDSDFSTPEEHASQNSVVEETDGSTVTQAADSTGATTTSTSNPGGYQIGYASLHSSGQGSSSDKAQDAATKKRGLYGGDFAVMWVRADDTGVNLQVNITTEQDW